MADDTFNKEDIMDMIPLDNKDAELAKQIINEDELAKVQDLTHLFNLQQAKKNVLRVIKLNKLLDKVSDQMIERFEKTPGQFSNADLLNYMQVTQASIDRAQKALNLVDESPAITLNQVNINVDDGVINRESRAKITEAVRKILQMSQKMDLEKEETSIIEVKDEEDTTETVINKDKRLLNEEE